VAGAWCEPHSVGELVYRQPVVGLQLGKDRSVYGLDAERLLPKIDVRQQKLQAFVLENDVTF
jgi:hypothetical protein